MKTGILLTFLSYLLSTFTYTRDIEVFPKQYAKFFKDILLRIYIRTVLYNCLYWVGVPMYGLIMAVKGELASKFCYCSLLDY